MEHGGWSGSCRVLAGGSVQCTLYSTNNTAIINAGKVLDHGHDHIHLMLVAGPQRRLVNDTWIIGR
jgi:hypothetical protein